MKKNIFRKLFAVLTLVFFISKANAANYYWRVTPVNNLYTDIANWETTPGGGLSPATAPSVNDDVFFPASITTARNINLNGGFSRNFNFNAGAIFTFSGSFTIHGSLIANGNANFNIVGASSYTGTSGNTLTFSGSGTHTIDMGTSSQRFSGGGAIFFTSNVTGGTYSLINHNWITDNTVRFNTQNFVSNGLQLDVRFMTVEGTATKTVNFSNSTVNITGTSGYSDNFFNCDFNTLLSATTYIMTNTRIVARGTGVFQMRVTTTVNIGSLTLNNGGTSTLYGYNVATAVFNLSMDSLIVNNSAVYIGRGGLDGPNSDVQTLNIGVIRFMKPSVIENYGNTTIGNTHAIIEAPICRGQSAIQGMSNNTLKFNPSTALVTNSLAYRSVVFGGGGVTTSNSFDLGLNSGSITWTAAVPATTFYWVGGTGSWNVPTNWSILGSGGAPQSLAGCTPTFADDVVFDANSFTSNQIVSIGAEGGYCRNITFSDPANEGLLQNELLYINGNANFTGARGINSSLRFVGSGTQTITSGTAFTYNSPSIVLAGTGTYTLADNFTANLNTTYFHHLSGRLNTNAKNITVGQFSSRPFPSIATNIRHINISNSVLTHRNLTSAGAYVFLDISYLGSFTATGSKIVQTDNLRRFRISAVANNTAGNYLTPLVFNDVSFPSPDGTTVFDNSSPIGTTAFFNNVSFSANANITKTFNHPITVDTFWVSSGRLYQFTNGHTFTITGAIVHNSTGCGELVRINSTTAGSRVNLYKAAAPFDVNGAIVKDVNASGTTMNIVGGQDAGNNLNVTVSSAVGRDMYWVNGTGNWSNGLGHWSIGVSGGNPAVTNPLGCIPRLVDNVFFDQNSFNTSNQTVTIDIDAECKNMLWDANAGSDQPIFAGASTRILNVWGNLELGAGMTSSFNGNLNMMGGLTTINTQSIRTNGVSLNAQLNMNGGGRYDQLDDINFNSGLSLNLGRFYTNQHAITAAHLYLDVRTPSIADISNSRIILNSGRIIPSTSTFYTYYAYHSGAGNWNAAGSYIRSNQREFTINNSVPVAYDTIVMNANTVPQFGSPTTQNVTAKWIEWRSAISNTLGNITTETLIYVQSSVNNLQAGRTVLVNDSLAAHGTPCIPTTIKSNTPGTLATLSSGNCSFNISFGALTDILAGTCTTPENFVIGVNGGNSSNWTFATVNPLSPLGDDTLVACQVLPFIQGTKGFGYVPATYLWNTGDTTSQLEISESGTYSVTVTYAPGCSVSGTREVTVIDTIAPVLTGPFPPDVTINCDTTIPSAITMNATDNCDAPVITVNDITTSGTCPNSYTITRTYRATDDVGNIDSYIQTINVQDIDPPTFVESLPANTTVNCDAVPSAAVLTATDNCTSNPAVTYTQVRTNGSCPNNYTLTRTWRSVDACNNDVSHTQIVTVQDTVAPFFVESLPADASVNCDAVPDPAVLTATDNCSASVVVNYTETTTQGAVGTCSESNYTITRTWSSTDDCSNTRTYIQTITVHDTLEPAFVESLPVDITVNCDAVPSAAVLTATDNCTPNPAVTYTQVRANGSCPNNYTLTRTWRAVDVCNNEISHIQVVTVQDTTAPIFSTCVSDTTIYTGSSACNVSLIDYSSYPGLLISDPCSGTVTITQSPVAGTLISEVNTVWIIAEDICGNKDSCSFTVTVVDTISPVLSNCPTNITVNTDAASCDAIVSWTAPTATDNCSVTLTSTHASGSTFGIGTTTVTYTAEDAAGNEVTCSFTVTVEDNENPVIANCPTDITVNTDAGSCNAVVNWTAPTATDNCSVTLTSTHNSGAVFPIGTTVVTYTAEDAAGNEVTCSFNVTVEDNENPIIANCPTNITVNTDAGSCDAIVTWTAPTATDNCSVTLTSTHASGSTFGIGTTTVTYTAEDAAGNEVTCSFTVTVADNENPVIANCPTDITINTDAASCNAVVSWTAPTATDNCSVTLTSTHNSGSTFGIGTTTVTYTAEDAAGNEVTCSFTVTVEDNENPVIANCPIDITINTDAGSCDAIVNWTAPTATDNCSVILTSTHNSGDVFPIGTTTVTYTAEDAAGNEVTCSFTVTVEDNENPVIANCPTNITVNTDTGSCDAIVTWTAPTATDNCSVTLTSTHNSGDVFPIGTTTVTYTAEDAAGNEVTCSFNVTVEDNENPVIANCPTNITVNTDAGSCDAIVTWTAPTATDNCSVTLTSTHASGSTFGIGTTVVTYTAEDAAGNEVTCSFNVTVEDNENPVIANCPTNITASTDAGSCDAIVSWTAPTATDNCSVTLTSTHASGSTFGIGTTTVTYTAEDAAGNEVTCSFTVTLEDNENPVIANCPTNITASTDAGSCNAIVSWTAPTATDNCSVTLTSTHNSGDVFPIGTTTVTYTAEDAAGNEVTCSFTVTVEDNENPVIANCPTDITVNTDAGSCDAIVSWTAPTATDNCSVTLTSTHASGSTFSIGTTVVTYTAEDAAGNEVTCSFTVTVADNENPIIANCPTNITVNTDAGSCDAIVSWTAPTATDNCSVTLTSTHNSGDVFPIGTTTVTYTAEDAAGNEVTCSFNVTVEDNENPVIANCPTDITINTDAGSCDAIVNWTAPTATDNCSVTLTSTHNSGDVFPIGTTTVTYTAEDAAGNEVTCSFTVTVADNENPVIANCPTDITINTDAGSCDAVVNWTAPTATDNCSVTLTSTHASGSTFAIGTTTVTYTAEDAAGNEVTCSFTVTVEDNENPVIANCPTDITINTDAGSCDAIVSWIAPTVTDNCSVTLTSTHNSGDVFPIGTTTVTYTAEDAAGNEVTCSFTVTVEDNENPVIANCPTDITINTDTGSCDAIVTWTAPTATDNCSVTLTSTHNSGDVFPIGTTTVTYTAEDAAGNEVTCSFNVTVEDNENPVIANCPTDITINTDAGSCNAVVTWTAPTATDNCSVTLTSTHNSGVVFPIGTTTVTYTAEDAAGNEVTCSFTVTVEDNEHPVIDIILSSVTFCEGEDVTWTENISDNCGVTNVVSTHNSGDVFPVGTTTVTYTATDVNGNISTYSFDVTIAAIPTVAIVSGESQKGCAGSSVSLSVVNPDNNNSYAWYFNDTEIGTEAFYEIPSAQPSDNGVYTVVVTNSGGCQAETEVTLTIETCGITIVETFSPNGDGQNEYFWVEGLETYPNTEVLIYNRWGAEVYQSDNYQNDWDGRSQSKLNVGGDELPEGTYFYVLKLGGDESQLNAGEMYKGYVYIKR